MKDELVMTTLEYSLDYSSLFCGNVVVIPVKGHDG